MNKYIIDDYRVYVYYESAKCYVMYGSTVSYTRKELDSMAKEKIMKQIFN